MPRKKQAAGTKNDATMPRASISFPREVYETLEGLAIKKKVSLAWVVREAVEKYVAEEWPLFRNMKRS